MAFRSNSLAGTALEAARKSMPEPRSAFACRECGAPVALTASSCPACNCKAPFACVECSKAVSAVTLGVTRSRKYPYGAFSAEGQPLCAEHRITRCHRCEELFPLHATRRESIGERADTNLRRGMSPRMEKVYGSFCPDCYQAVQPSSSRGHRAAEPNYKLFTILLLIFLTVMAGIGALIVSLK